MFQNKKEVYRDTEYPAVVRAKDLLDRLTLREKVGQINQRLYGFNAYSLKGDEIRISDDFKTEVEKWGGLGVLYGLYRADPWSGKDYENGLLGEKAIKTYNLLQEYVIAHSRFGIPMLLSSECPHGHQALDGYILPVNLAMGATFHPALVEEAYRICGRQMREMGVDMALISMLDVLRDPRWGRSEECFGEDPYLASVMAAAVVKSVQAEGVDVVSKHFAAQGETTGGVNASAARIGERELREIHLPAAKATVRAGAAGIMAAYNEIDGIPCHANGWLLKKVLREEMGFSGIVMADGFAVDRLNMLTGDTVRSGAVALLNGVDVSLWDDGFSKLEEAVKQGLIEEKRLDEAVLKVLELKFRRGLFEHPYLEKEKRLFDFTGYPENRYLAEESAVLLKNENGLLPLSEDKISQIAVIGPNALDIYSQLGDYSPPLKNGAGCSIADGIVRYTAEKSAVRTVVCKGCGDEDKQGLLMQAIKAAEESDVTLLVLGGTSSRFGEARFDKNGAIITDKAKKANMDCGEGVDLSTLVLTEEQIALADAVYSAARKTVTVVIAGRPYDIRNILERTDALLYAFYPGPEGGTAMARLLFGEVEPSGRLPVSIPRSADRLPAYYNYRSSYEAMHYCDGEDGPLFPFGYGLGYGIMEYSGFQLSEDRICAEENDIILEFSMKNIGNRPEWGVPMVFIRHRSGSVIPRTEELVAFDKRRLEPGESCHVRFALGKEAFAVWNDKMEYVTEPGAVCVKIRDGQKDLWNADIELL
ncbi:MAG: beta-glucosidase [Clostridiales bacterium]|nr:beta-glucosidase [Clostridiales bacterium]